MKKNNTADAPVEHPFLRGGGEMGRLMREKDWSQTPLGSPDGWPHSLRTTLGILLNSKFPMFLFWGEQLLCLYNDAYRPSLGNDGKHPHALGQPAVEIWSEIWHIIKPLLDQVRTSGEATWSEDQLIPFYRNGQIEDIYWTFSYSPVFDELGRVQGVLTICTETTEKVENLKKLAESKDQFMTLLEMIPNIAWNTDSEGRLTFVTQRWYEYTGQSAEQTFSNGWEMATHSDDLPAAIEKMMHSLATGKPYMAEYRLRRADGAYRWHLARATAVRNEGGAIVSWLGAITDIHEQKQKQVRLDEVVRQRTQQLEASVQELRRSNENLQQFAYVASHDLQEPLRKIQSFGDMLKKRYETQLGDGADYLNRMQSAAKRMSVLIEDLLTFSRITTRQEAANDVPLDQVLNSVLINLELRIKESRAVIEAQSLPVVQGDTSQLTQMFQNLLSNAIKFQKPDSNPVIRIITEKVDAADISDHVRLGREAAAYHRIDITDNGIGFEVKYLDRIFEVFQRLHGKSEYTGTGIGLAICQKVAINHGGAITASSQLGAGATFSVYLPV